MRHTARTGNFLLCLFFNLLMNMEGTVPGLILLALHLWLGISVWWSVGAFILWILRILFGMWFMGWAADCGREKDPPKENKNPYSKKSIYTKE